MNERFPNLPPRIAKLPQDHRGFPIPWFVATLPKTGERDFRVADQKKRNRAIRNKLCWVCGERLGKFQCFVVGPMCTITRSTSEPPCHLDCAVFSVSHCPFLTKPRMRRNDQGLDEHGIVDPPGEMIERNPGTSCIWITKNYRVFKVEPSQSGQSDYLIEMGDPTSMLWFYQGKNATREQVDTSIYSGIPILQDMAEKEGPKAVIELTKLQIKLITLLDKFNVGRKSHGEEIQESQSQTP
jgi:hypothetical protein